MTKEVEARVKIFQQAMVACHSSNPTDCVEWFADRIVELEAENEKAKEIILKQKNIIENVCDINFLSKDCQKTLMKDRCYNPKNIRYHCYGGRGITICEEWLAPYWGYKNFKKWALSHGYRDDLNILFTQ